MELTDEKLYQLCQTYGERARMWKNKFAGLLPEVFKRKLYTKKGFGSIFEFAAKLAGMSEEQVRRVLNLEKKFESTPALQSLLQNGEVSVNKLAKIASIATAENEEQLANQVKLLSTRALETLVRDEKTVHVNTHPQEKSEYVNLLDHFSEELKQKLVELLEKGLDLNQVLLELLAKRELEIIQEKEEIAQETKETSSRYLSVKIKKVLTKEYGTKCSIQGCPKLAKNIHHSQRYGLAKSHDPHYLAPLCPEHHEIAHTIDLQFHAMRQIALRI